MACDASSSRVDRLRECLQSYLPEAQLRKVAVLRRDILTPGDLGQQSYDKVRRTGGETARCGWCGHAMPQ